MPPIAVDEDELRQEENKTERVNSESTTVVPESPSNSLQDGTCAT